MKSAMSKVLHPVGGLPMVAHVVRAASALLHSETSAVSALFLGTALEQLGRATAADSAYSFGLRRSPRDAALLGRLRALRSR